jgi:glucose/arabinose dehydrogenase
MVHAGPRARAHGGLSTRWAATGVVLVVVVLGPRAAAATLPAGFAETRIVSGLTSPTAMAAAPDGRIFVCEQGGSLRVIKDGVLLPTPFLSVTVDAAGERGLLGVAFDPDFGANQYVYVYYTATTTPRRNRIARFTASGDVALAGSEIVIAELDDLSSATNHNGGAIHFGPDGKLYAAVGDNANGNNAPSLSTRLGKMLRLNADGTIPGDNPFVTQAVGDNRSIWAIGLRNPFTFRFQRGTGRMFINDVGQSTWEEINDGMAGADYGWPSSEGPPPALPDPDITYPIFAYGHGSTATTGCAITGGAFYDATFATFPAEYFGTYFFADLCSGWIRRLDPITATATGFATGISQPVDLFVSPAGDLYYLARGSGEVWQVRYEAGINAARPSVDLGGDGRDDVVWREQGGSVYAWFMNGREVEPGSSFLPSPELSWQVVGLGDFDGDGQGDLLWRHEPTGATYVWLMSGASIVGNGFTSAQADTTWRVVGTGDFDGDVDGTSDVLWRHPSGALALWQMSGTEVSSSGPLPAVGPGWRIRGIGDFDGDDHADILWRHIPSGITYVWFMSGTSVVNQGFTASQGDTTWHVVAIADVDGDARSDVLWRHDGGASYAWLMDGTSLRPGSGPLPAVGSSWRIESVGQFDGDGRGDLLWREATTGTTYLWLMNGTQILDSGFTSGQAGPNWTIQPPPR